MFIKIQDHILRIGDIKYTYYDESNEVLKVYLYEELRPTTSANSEGQKTFFEFKMDESDYNDFVDAMIGIDE